MSAAAWRGEGGTGRFPRKTAAEPHSEKGAHGGNRVSPMRACRRLSEAAA